MASNQSNFVVNYDTVVLKRTVESPSLQSGRVDLNGHVFTSKMTTDTSTDPRLLNASRNMRLRLSHAPIDGSVKESAMYDHRALQYGGVYTSYANIGSGQIVYYVDKSLQDAFPSPNFTEKVEIVKSVFTDPMGSVKTMYTRNQLNPENPLLHPQNSAKDYGLSFLRDTNQQREDIMASQMAVMNRNRWAPLNA